MQSLITITTAMLAAIALPAFSEQCDQALGKKVYSKCAVCHQLSADAESGAGPNLFTLFERNKASLTGFPYSPAMLALKGKWDKKSLDDFLKKPMSKVPGTTMAFAGLRKEKQRQAVICYIELQTAAIKKAQSKKQNPNKDKTPEQ